MQSRWKWGSSPYVHWQGSKWNGFELVEEYNSILWRYDTLKEKIKLSIDNESMLSKKSIYKYSKGSPLLSHLNFDMSCNNFDRPIDRPEKNGESSEKVRSVWHRLQSSPNFEGRELKWLQNRFKTLKTGILPPYFAYKAHLQNQIGRLEEASDLIYICFDLIPALLEEFNLRLYSEVQSIYGTFQLQWFSVKRWMIIWLYCDDIR